MFTNGTRQLWLGAAALLGAVTACAPDGASETSSTEQTVEGDVAIVPGPKQLSQIRPLPGVKGERTTASMSPTAVPESATGRYFVHFAEEPLASEYGALRRQVNGSAGLRKKQFEPRLGNLRAALADVQSQHLREIAMHLGHDAVKRRYDTALNAAVLEISHAEALEVAQLKGVAFVEPDQILPLLTDRGPTLIGAPTVWNGTSSGVASKGEGQVVGIIDTGIAFDVEIDGTVGAHPAFAATAEDGYTHVNPLGEGTYLGGCVEHPEWCNSKLIGIYNMLIARGGVDATAPDASPIYGFKDVNGHGSHVASTAAGNPIAAVPVLDAEGTPVPGFSYRNLSGVAPRANIISYKVCAGGCATSDVVASVDQAIRDGVDVINHSIGSESGSPWRATKSLAFLRARDAGIFVASAAGNEGPAAGTGAYVGSAPWTAGVAATTHDRAFVPKALTGLSGGDTAAPTGITGNGLTAGFTGRIVYAKNYKVGAAGQPNFDTPELCLEAFPAGTFEADQIVVCDRGVNARTDKGKWVRAGGAGGLIVANVAGGATSVDPDAHVIPAIHISAAHGTQLKTWLATGTGHVGTIEPSPPIGSDLNAADIMADFSSRGPYAGFDFLGPRIAAPGVNIIAAGAAVPTAGSVPGLWGAISGTSMASPHLAGTAALLKAVRPTWTNAEVLSALVTTGKTTVRKENKITPADVHDIGGGRVQLDKAVRAGLLLDETTAGFLAGNPATGGDPGQLNVAELVRHVCVVECGWKRTVKATAAATWTVTGSPFIRVTPATFTLAAGQTQVLDIQVDGRALPLDVYNFGSIVLTPSSSELSEQHIPAVVKIAGSNLPAQKNITATRTQGSSVIRGVKSIAVEALSFKVSGLSVASKEGFEVAQDSNNASAYDDVTDGIFTKIVPFPTGAEQFIVEITETDSQDLDLRVGLDQNGDGLPSENEQVCVQATAATLERCVIELAGAAAGLPPFWISVQNWTASEPDALDSVTLATTVVGTAPTGNLTVTGPTGAIAPATPYDLTLNWTSPANVGDIAYGKVKVYRKAEQTAANLLGTVAVRLVRAANDVAIALPALVKTNDPFAVTLTVGPNYEDVARNYSIEVPLPQGVSHVTGGALRGRSVFVDVSVPASTTTTTNTTTSFQVRAARSLGGQTLTLTANDTVDNPNSVRESTTASVKLSRYAFSGFLFPTPPNATVIGGLPVVLNFQVLDAATNRPIRGLVVNIEIKDPAGAVKLSGPVNTPVFDNYFHSFGTGGWAGGKYTVTATLDDGTSYDSSFTIWKLFGR